VLAAAAPPWISTLSQQVRYALQALSYERGAPVERLYLCGSGSGAPNADWRISEQLDLPVTLLAPEPARGADQAAFAVAYGCAVQAAGAAQLTLNLTPARITVAREVEQRRQNVLSWGALASAVVLATGLVFGAAVYQKQQALAAAESRLRALGMAAPAPPIPAADLKAVATAVDEASEARVRPADLLALLSAQLPTGAWLAELTYNSETGAVVRGYSTSSGGAQAAQNRMLRQQVFDEVLLDYVTEEQIGDVPVWGFQLTCRLRPKEQPRRGQRPAAGTRR